MKKNRYSTYNFLLGVFARTLKKTYKRKFSDVEVLKYVAEIQGKSFLYSHAAPLAEEDYWRNETTCPAIFPKDSTTLNKILKTKYKVTMMEGIAPPFESFILCFPRGFTIEGVQMPGCLVTDMPVEKREEEVIQNTYRKVYKGGINTEGEKEPFIAINFTKNSEELFRVCVPRRRLPEVLASKSPKETESILGKLHTRGGFETPENVFFIQHHLLKIIAAIYVYAQAEPTAIVPGFPADNRPNIEGNNHKRCSDFTLGTVARQGSNDSPEAHYRSGHYRQLSNPIYYRGEHKDKPIGSRIVWVKDTYVGKEIDPHTLKKDY